MSASCSHRVPGVVLIGNAAAKGSAVNGTGPEARADVHRADFSNRDWWARRHEEGTHRGNTRWMGEGEKGGGWPSLTGKSWRSSTLTKGILLSESLLPPDGQKSERARCNYRARRESSLALDSHGEASRLEKDQQKAPISARWHASLKDWDTMRQYTRARIHVHAKKSSFTPFYYPAFARIEIDLIPISIPFFPINRHRNLCWINILYWKSAESEF